MLFFNIKERMEEVRSETVYLEYAAYEEKCRDGSCPHAVESEVPEMSVGKQYTEHAVTFMPEAKN